MILTMLAASDAALVPYKSQCQNVLHREQNRDVPSGKVAACIL